MWKKWGNYAMRNGNYSISKAATAGVFKYALWQIEPLHCYGWFNSFDEAKAQYERLQMETL